ncbi:Cytochrome P450 [Diaporthe amygdali]|uniref:Cytochrome P450 n=1 Tax=Phomopsis amygdali TaxID=1214568 RepID=UPI0022FE6AB5|nr:Cytochrome P450 [Diaporthe amygdali]KAJ0114037.1 Cytochrome P450 [Diaporthe amygdali]
MEKEIYGNTANPAVQDWVSEEIHHVMGNHRPEDWVYSDISSLKRCLAVMYETLRLYTPVPTSKIGTMSVPSYASLQTNPKFWGEDSLVWRSSSFIKASPSGALDKEDFLGPDRGTFLAWSWGMRDYVGRKFSPVEEEEGETQEGETQEGAQKRILSQIENDYAPVLLLQMLHREKAPLVWREK